jgi:hypothetical protein
MSLKLVFTLRFWNNIHQVCSRPKDWKTNWFIRRWEQKKTKRPKQENQSSIMPEGGDPKRKRNPSKMDNPETLALATMSTQTSR